MRYSEERPAPELQALVECIWFLTDTPGHGNAASRQPILPDGCVELIFHFQDRFYAIGRGGAPVRQPAAFVVGMLTAPMVLCPAERVDTMAVRFRPGGARPFFAGPLSALTDAFVSLEDLWGYDQASQLWERLAARPDRAARVAIIARALNDRLAGYAGDPPIAAAVTALVASGGRDTIDAIAARSGVTIRQLQRRFADGVGVRPKMLARILRFQRTLLQRAEPRAQGPDWVRIAVDCGYADQSHLIRDYAAFAGATPATLLAAEAELSAYFTAPHRLAAVFSLPRAPATGPLRR